MPFLDSTSLKQNGVQHDPGPMRVYPKGREQVCSICGAPADADSDSFTFQHGWICHRCTGQAGQKPSSRFSSSPGGQARGSRQGGNGGCSGQGRKSIPLRSFLSFFNAPTDQELRQAGVLGNPKPFRAFWLFLIVLFCSFLILAVSAIF